MVSRKFGAIFKRILAAIVMIPIAVTVLYVGSPYIEVLAIVVGGLLAWEWANMLSSPVKSSYYVTAYIITLAVAIWSYNATVISVTTLVSTVLVWYLADKEKGRSFYLQPLLYPV